MLKPCDAWTDEQFEAMERDSFFINQANAFLDVLEDRALPLCTLEEGLQTLRVNLAALASLDRGCWETIESNHAS